MSLSTKTAFFRNASLTGEDIFFEATAADGAEAFAVGGDKKTGAGAAVGRSRNGDEGGEDGVGRAGTRPGERSELGRKIVHRVGSNRAKGRGKKARPIRPFRESAAGGRRICRGGSFSMKLKL